MMTKKILSIILVLAMTGVILAGCGSSNTPPETAVETSNIDAATTAATEATEAPQPEAPREDVEIEVVASNPEYEAQEREAWSVYEKANPNVKIKLVSFNDENALQTRIAGGDPPAICTRIYGELDKTTYKNYVNLMEINYPYLDKLQIDPKAGFEKETGIKDYMPTLVTVGSWGRWAFLYHKDEMDKAGLNPRDTVKTMDDLDKFLVDLKGYVDKTPSIKYVWDTGWSGFIWGRSFMTAFAFAQGSDQNTINDLWSGKIAWDDMEKNPYVPVFKKIKEWYDKGYLPKEWWTRIWDTDFEAGFIAKKSIFTLHGPWLWDKVLAANSSAQITGFPIPANKDGNLVGHTLNMGSGSAIFEGIKAKKGYDEVVKAFIWFNSPEAVKMRCEILGLTSAMDLGEFKLNLSSKLYTEVQGPMFEGKWGNIKWYDGPLDFDSVILNKVEGRPEVMIDDTNAAVWGKYLSGKMTLEDMMKTFKARWTEKYKF